MLNADQKLVCFRNLCKTATTNNFLTPTGEDILLEAGQKMGINDLQVWNILKSAYNLGFMVPEGEDLQKEYLAYTIKAMIVQCDLPDLGYEWTLAIAKQMALSLVVVLRMIERLSREACLASLF